MENVRRQRKMKTEEHIKRTYTELMDKIQAGDMNQHNEELFSIWCNALQWVLDDTSEFEYNEPKTKED